MVTTHSKLPFGKHRGLHLEQCPHDYLKWMRKELRDTDLHEWALAADEALREEPELEQHDEELEAEADHILEEHGIDPRHVE